jgi:hypothetical protein
MFIILCSISGRRKRRRRISRLVTGRYGKKYIEKVYSLFMSFGFCIKKAKLSEKEEINKIKLNFFTQTFENVNLFNSDNNISTVKENATLVKSSKTKLFGSLESSIIMCNGFYN